jgi:DNA-binding transcriptional ArsR family regulator
MTRAATTARVDVFVALADPSRRELLDLLRKGPMPVHEMAREFSVTRPAISQHLRILRDANLVRETKVGRERHYRLQAAALKQVSEWVKQYEAFWDDKLRRLGDTLNAMPVRKQR